MTVSKLGLGGATRECARATAREGLAPRLMPRAHTRGRDTRPSPACAAESSSATVGTGAADAVPAEEVGTAAPAPAKTPSEGAPAARPCYRWWNGSADVRGSLLMPAPPPCACDSSSRPCCPPARPRACVPSCLRACVPDCLTAWLPAAWLPAWLYPPAHSPFRPPFRPPTCTLQPTRSAHDSGLTESCTAVENMMRMYGPFDGAAGDPPPRAFAERGLASPPCCSREAKRKVPLAWR